MLNQRRTRKLLQERGVFSKKWRVFCCQFSPILSVIPAIEWQGLLVWNDLLKKSCWLRSWCALDQDLGYRVQTWSSEGSYGKLRFRPPQNWEKTLSWEMCITVWAGLRASRACAPSTTSVWEVLLFVAWSAYWSAYISFPAKPVHCMLLR